MIPLIIMAFACKSKSTFPEEYKGLEIHFGQGGGFTGAVQYFVLLEDGRLYQKEIKDTAYTLLDQWTQDFTDQMFWNYHFLGLDTVQHYEPGDLYYFIEYHSKEDSVHRIGWGNPGFIPSPNLIRFYNLLYKSTKTKS